MRAAIVLVIVLCGGPVAAGPAAEPTAAGHGGAIDEMDCSACHSSASWKLGPAAGASGFDHDRTGFPLRGAHVATPCGDCHERGARPPTECQSCHRDPHQRRATAPCGECHAATAWPDTAALDRHRRTRMPLTGRHALIDCVACHERTGERSWSGVPVTCWSCHADDYRDPSTHPDHDGDPAEPARAPFPRDCGRCHRTAGWQPALFDPTILGRSLSARLDSFDHDRRFVLSTGPHRDAACRGCHVDPRRDARVSCAGCHDAGDLRARHRKPVSTSAGACLHCHPRGAKR